MKLKILLIILTYIKSNLLCADKCNDYTNINNQRCPEAFKASGKIGVNNDIILVCHCQPNGTSFDVDNICLSILTQNIGTNCHQCVRPNDNNSNENKNDNKKEKENKNENKKEKENKNNKNNNSGIKATMSRLLSSIFK